MPGALKACWGFWSPDVLAEDPGSPKLQIHPATAAPPIPGCDVSWKANVREVPTRASANAAVGGPGAVTGRVAVALRPLASVTVSVTW